jgi:hypothetical protein
MNNDTNNRINLLSKATWGNNTHPSNQTWCALKLVAILWSRVGVPIPILVSNESYRKSRKWRKSDRSERRLDECLSTPLVQCELCIFIIVWKGGTSKKRPETENHIGTGAHIFRLPPGNVVTLTNLNPSSAPQLPDYRLRRTVCYIRSSSLHDPSEFSSSPGVRPLV